MNVAPGSRAGIALVGAWRRHWPPEMGWPVAVAAALLLLAALAQVGLAPAWRAELAQMQTARPGPGTNGKAPAIAAAVPWPEADQAPTRLADLLELAVREGLDLRRSRERLDAASASYVLDMQARGSYESVRSFLAMALAADPALALESLRLQRPTGEDTALSIEMQWRLLHQPRSGSRPLSPNAPRNANANANADASANFSPNLSPNLSPNISPDATASRGLR